MATANLCATSISLGASECRDSLIRPRKNCSASSSAMMIRTQQHGNENRARDDAEHGNNEQQWLGKSNSESSTHLLNGLQ